MQPPYETLIASGWAGQTPMRNVALQLHKMKQTGDLGGFSMCVEVLDLWIKGEATRHGLKTGGSRCPQLIVGRVLYWWLDPHCRHCSSGCDRCNGTGTTTLDTLVKPEHIRTARVLAQELERITYEVLGDMRQLQVSRDVAE